MEAKAIIYTEPTYTYNDAGQGYESDGDRILIKNRGGKTLVIGEIAWNGNSKEKKEIISQINELFKKL